MICPFIGRTYKFVRIGEEIIIAESEAEYHVDILRTFGGFEGLDRREMTAKIRVLPDVDMGRMRREEGGKIVVYGESITFQFPDETTKQKVRPKTMEILRKVYSGEEFASID